VSTTLERDRQERGADERAIFEFGPTMCHLFSLIPGILHQSELRIQRGRVVKSAEDDEKNMQGRGQSQITW